MTFLGLHWMYGPIGRDNHCKITLLQKHARSNRFSVVLRIGTVRKSTIPIAAWSKAVRKARPEAYRNASLGFGVRNEYLQVLIPFRLFNWIGHSKIFQKKIGRDLYISIYVLRFYVPTHTSKASGTFLFEILKSARNLSISISISCPAIDSELLFESKSEQTKRGRSYV